MNRLRAWWAWFYGHHVQKTMALVLGGSALYDEAADAYTALVTYAPELGDLLGHSTYRRVRMACVVLIFVRAVWKPKPP